MFIYLFIFSDVMPDSCEGKSFCFDKGDSYPDDKIDELLKDINVLVSINL